MAALPVEPAGSNPIELLVKVFSSPPDTKEIFSFIALVASCPTRAEIINKIQDIVNNHFSLEETHALSKQRVERLYVRRLTVKKMYSIPDQEQYELHLSSLMTQPQDCVISCKYGTSRKCF